MRSWAIQCNIAVLHLTLLLSALRHFFPSLPKCGATLLKRCSDIKPQMLTNGKFVYFGILNTIKPLLEPSTPSNLTMVVHIDGTPLYKSSNQQFWPILAKIPEVSDNPLVIAIFSGTKKPEVNDFLLRFVDEILELSHEGFTHCDTQYTLHVKHFTCDLPAMAYIKQIKGHSGYSSCPKCVVTGDYGRRSVYFLNNNVELRSDTTFRSKSDEDHHIGVSPLERLPIDMIKSFPIDSMHLIYLGIVRKIMNIWISGNNTLAKFSSDMVRETSRKLMNLRSFVPYEFKRKPRPLNEIKYWKATEFRNFVLYYGLVVLKDCGNEILYKNFLLLHSITYYLNRSSLDEAQCDYVKTLIEAFLNHSKKLYGNDFFSLNVHLLNPQTTEVKKSHIQRMGSIRTPIFILVLFCN